MRQAWGVAACAAAGLFVVLALLVAGHAVAPADAVVRGAVHAASGPALTVVAGAVTWFGALGVLALFGALFGAWLWRAWRRWDAWWLAGVMAAAVVLENALKFGVQRARPLPFFGVDPVTWSFPSGHSMFSVCFYGGVAALLGGRRGAVAAGVLVGAIGLSRIYLGVHYPSDVLGGYLAGGAVLAGGLAVRAGQATGSVTGSGGRLGSK